MPNTLNIEFPGSSWRPIPHYIQVRDLAINLAVLLLSLPNFKSVVSDVEEQSEESGDYDQAVWILRSIEDAIDTLDTSPPNSEGLPSVISDVQMSMENWGPAATAIFYLMQAHPNEAGSSVSDLITQALAAIEAVSGKGDE